MADKNVIADKKMTGRKFNDDLQTALRISNAIAILMMFFCGWNLGKYAGRNRYLM